MLLLWLQGEEVAVKVKDKHCLTRHMPHMRLPHNLNSIYPVAYIPTLRVSFLTYFYSDFGVEGCNLNLKF